MGSILSLLILPPGLSKCMTFFVALVSPVFGGASVKASEYWPEREYWLMLVWKVPSHHAHTLPQYFWHQNKGSWLALPKNILCAMTNQIFWDVFSSYRSFLFYLAFFWETGKWAPIKKLKYSHRLDFVRKDLGMQIPETHFRGNNRTG